MNLRSVTSLMLIGTSLALLFHFGMIAVFGTFYIKEPNKLILTLEILTLLMATGIGIVGFIREVK